MLHCQQMVLEAKRSVTPSSSASSSLSHGTLRVKLVGDFGPHCSSPSSRAYPFWSASGQWLLGYHHGKMKKHDSLVVLSSTTLTSTPSVTEPGIMAGIRSQWTHSGRCILMERLISRVTLLRSWNIDMIGRASNLRLPCTSSSC